MFDSFSVNGPMARSVADAALMLSVMAGPDSRVPIPISESGDAFAAFRAPDDLKGWRVAWAPTLGGLFRVDAEVARVASTAAARFAELGCQVEDATPDLRAAPQVIKVLRAMRSFAVHQQQVAAANQLESAWLRLQLVGRREADNDVAIDDHGGVQKGLVADAVYDASGGVGERYWLSVIDRRRRRAYCN